MLDMIFTKVRNIIGCPSDLIIISDQYISIKNAVAFVFSETADDLCGFHMKNNVM